MYNHNAVFLSESDNPVKNRAFLYADAVFETVRIHKGKVLFLEDHYFRLMSGMRIVRMEIPMEFTMEYIEKQILETASANNCVETGRARMTVYRNGNGFYLPETNSVSFLITAEPLGNPQYVISENPYEVELYKDFHVAKHLLSSVKTTAKTINVTGSVFARENGYDNCILINEEKNVIEALNGNIFLLHNEKLVTPPVSEGCIKGVMRSQILDIARKSGKWTVEEAAVSPFDLQKADEFFITNVIQGIQPITKYRKKDFGTSASVFLTEKLNELISPVS